MSLDSSRQSPSHGPQELGQSGSDWLKQSNSLVGFSFSKYTSLPCRDNRELKAELKKGNTFKSMQIRNEAYY
jgi:hypothetical protein